MNQFYIYTKTTTYLIPKNTIAECNSTSAHWAGNCLTQKLFNFTTLPIRNKQILQGAQ